MNIDGFLNADSARNLLGRLRVATRPEELALVSGGYRAEVERMQREVLDYLTQPATTARAG